MPISKFARSAAAIAAATMLPAHAIASAPQGMAVASSSFAAQADDAADAEEGQPFFSSQYLIPTVIVLVLVIGLYFFLEDGDDDEGPGTVTP